MSRREIANLAPAVAIAAAAALWSANASGADAIETPTDPVAKAAFDMLNKHCARCHQDGRLAEGRLRPAKNFGNILNLDQISKSPQLIQAGNPDGSLIFNQLAKQEMPYDLYSELKPGVAEPTAEELTALRTWIESLKGKGCETRKFVSNSDLVSGIADDLKGAPISRVKGTRYLTLSNLYNSCAEDAAMEVYRQGAVKLLNSLSRSSDVVRLETIDPAKTILRFNLADVGWEDADWNAILAVYPYRVKPDDKLFDFTASAAGTSLAYVRADWFAFTASQPGLYNSLLKLPKDVKGLEAQVGLNIADNVKNQRVIRIGAQVSGVSQHNRLIERHQIKTGYFWTSYDFGGNKDKQSLFNHPTGPGGENGFAHDGGESIFSLPNGFQAYFLSKADGTSLDKGPTQIVRDPGRKDQAVTNGISCMGCHDQGIRNYKDEIRAHVLADKTSFAKEIRDAVDALHPTQDKADVVLKDDAGKFRAAMQRAALNPGLKYGGVEMINALATKYEANVDLAAAAAEFGLKAEAFQSASRGSASANALLRRLVQGLAPRDQFENQFPELLKAVSDDKMMDPPKTEVAAAAPDKQADKSADKQPEKAADKPPANGTSAKADDAKPVVVAKVKSDGLSTTTGFDLALTSNQIRYRQKENAIFTIVSKKDCALTLTSIDNQGRGTILFPNQFDKDNKIPANKELRFGDKPQYKYILKDKGVETVIAECALPEAATRGIKPTHKDGGFTNLGNYSKALTRQIVIVGQQVKQEAAAKSNDLDAAAKKESAVVRTAIKIAVE